MMKRTGVRLGPDEPAPLTSQNPVNLQQQPGVNTMHAISQSSQQQILDFSLAGATAMLSVGGVGGAFVRAARPQAPLLNYLKPPPTAVQYAPKPQQPLQQQQQQQQMQMQQRHKPMGSQSPGAAPPPPAQFQRLKVEDALSYLDQVKYKFNTQPQVYNDFLDIMKEFKSQTIDTPGVITRVSTLFKGHPELIVGFNTFLPPGYKIEVQSNGQVSVSMPSPSSLGAVGVGGSVMIPVHHGSQPPLVHLLPVPQSVSNAIVHNLSVIPQAQPLPQPPPPPPPPPQNTLHHIQQAHQQIEAAAIQQQQQQHHGGGGGGGPSPAPHAPTGQPVEFNHAIEYVNKIKSRFNRQPDKYKRFLEILHAYQRGHREQAKHNKHQTEQEVYSQVAKLFENQEDLLVEFGQFLPDAKHHYPPPPSHSPHHQLEDSPERYSMPPAPSPPQVIHTQPPAPVAIHQQAPIPKPPVVAQGPPQHHLKRSPSFTATSTQMGAGAVGVGVGVGVGACPAKKPRACPLGAGAAGVRDVSYAEAARSATLHEYNYFDRVRKALRNQEVYDNFLRCLLLYTNEIISGSELICVTQPLLCRHPELQRWLQHFVTPHALNDHSRGYENMDSSVNSTPTYERERLGSESKGLKYEPIGPLAAQLRFDRPQGDAAMDIDLSTCKRLGTSYCALPRSADAARRCSGRTHLCREVLNDTWVSFPTWSEDSTFVTSRKTQYEEYIYRCEDERFELDVVIETNASTILVLEGVQKKLTRMSAEEAAKYRLDDCLGGHSPTIHQRALRRIYGDKVAVDIIAGLKKNPVVAVPVVLRRLKAKEEEWREAQKGFNKQWREQNEKYYLKSLDHQGINFKQNDLKAMRSKSLFNEVESAYAARKPGPHVVLDFNCKSRQEAIRVVRDVSELLIHHARRQTTIQKAEKRRIKQLLRQFIPDLFNHPRIPLSDDEREEDEKDEAASPGSPADDNNDDRQKNDIVKQEKDKQSSESDNSSDKSAKTNKNSKDKENKPKNINSTDSKESTVNKVCTVGSEGATNNVKRSNSNEDSVKSEVKPEPAENEDDYRDRPPHSSTFVCSMSWYLFLRLHGVVCARVCTARAAARAQASSSAPSHHHHHHHAARLQLEHATTNLPTELSSPSEYYTALLDLVKGVLDGNVDPSTYEDAAREMLGIKAYPVYTLDKLVSYAVRQLQHCVSESWSSRCQELFVRGAGGGSTAHYKRTATAALRPHAAFLYNVHSGDECRVTFELLESAGEGRTSPLLNNDNSRLSPTNQPRQQPNGETVSRVAAWSLYTERFVQPHTRGHSESESPSVHNSNALVFLRRNVGAARRHEGNVAREAGGPPPARHPGRRKPLRLSDTEHATLTNRLRLIAARPLIVYRKGCLLSAQQSHQRLHTKRRERLRRWLRGQVKDAL